MLVLGHLGRQGRHVFESVSKRPMYTIAPVQRAARYLRLAIALGDVHLVHLLRAHLEVLELRVAPRPFFLAWRRSWMSGDFHFSTTLNSTGSFGPKSSSVQSAPCHI